MQSSRITMRHLRRVSSAACIVVGVAVAGSSNAEPAAGTAPATAPAQPSSALAAPAPSPPVQPGEVAPVEQRQPTAAMGWVAPVVSGTLALAGLGVGGYYGISALSRADDYKAQPTIPGALDAEHDATIATVGLVSGVVFAAVTVWLVFVPTHTKRAVAGHAAIEPVLGGVRF
jgi:hypothetical protein